MHFGGCSRLLKCWQNSSPVKPGSCQSTIQASKWASSSAGNASSAVRKLWVLMCKLRNISVTISRVVRLSSMTMTVLLCSASMTVSGIRLSWGCCNGNCSSIKNVVPCPGLLTTPIPCSFICLTMRWLMASPSPVPPYFRVVEVSAWVKAWNKRLRCCSSMPIPVSVTDKRK